jgi:CheY-like chemotaxis protein
MQDRAFGASLFLQGRRVLVAEDNAINQTVARKMLAKLGARVTVVSDGQQAVDAVAAARGEAAYDMVLMDMVMPGMGGTEATRVRTGPRFAGVANWVP